MPQITTPGMKTAQKNTQGGFNTASIFSGQVAPSLLSCPGAVAVGADALLFSGAGRLDLAFFHQTSASGLPIIFYDAAAPVSGGPIPASGHKIVGILPGTQSYAAVSSGQQAPSLNLPIAGTPVLIQVAFQSGLCVNSRSGQNGFTVCWTPEAPNQ